MNINNGNNTYFLVGSNELKISPLFLKGFSIPGVSFNNVNIDTKYGTNCQLAGDTLKFNDLDLEIIINDNYESYFEILNRMLQQVDYTYGSFSDQQFNIWVLINNNDNENVFLFDFFNCKINTISDIPLTNDTEPCVTFNISVSYDYYKFERYKDIQDCENKIHHTISTIRRYKEYPYQN